MKQNTLHTPEPWEVSEAYSGSKAICIMRSYEKTSNVQAVSDMAEPHGYDATEANAARIVSCVNACAGMVDPEATIRGLIEALELALSTIDDADGSSHHVHGNANLTKVAERDREHAMEVISAALAKAKEAQP